MTKVKGSQLGSEYSVSPLSVAVRAQTRGTRAGQPEFSVFFFFLGSTVWNNGEVWIRGEEVC